MNSGLVDLACRAILVVGGGLALFFLGYLCHAWRKALGLLIDRQQPATSHSRQAMALIGIVTDAALAVDGLGRVTVANPAAERLFDRAAHAAGHRNIDRLIPCPALADALAVICRRGATPIESFEVELDAQPEHRKWYHVTARAWLDPAAETGQTVVLAMRDISKQKTAQRRNADLVSGISHEMKTPLAGIKAYVELLIDGDAEDRATQQEFLNVINGQADRLLKLVGNLVTMAEVEAATAGAGRQNCSLAALLSEAQDAVQPRAVEKQISLLTDFDPRDLSVPADRKLLAQALVQLLSNAVKYTPTGGSVVLRSRTLRDRARIEIEDNGVGLRPEDCSKVFEKFYRVAEHREMAAGTGLGLPLARHIVENLHGGTLSVESQLGRGSLFAVELALCGESAGVVAEAAEEGFVDGEKSLALR